VVDRADEASAGPRAAEAEPQVPLAERRGRQRYVVVGLAAAGLAALTGVMLLAHVDLDNALLLYLLAVIVIAVTGGWTLGLVSAVVAFALGNYLFTAPVHDLDPWEPDHLVELVVFLAVTVVVSVVVDTAAKHRAAAAEHRQQAGVLAELDRVRSGLLVAVSHDLRTPLAGIKANASALRESGAAWDEAVRSELLAAIEESADQLAEMVSNLLAMSRLRAGAVSADLGPAAVYEVVARALAGIHDHRTDVDVPEDLPLALADPALLERVVANLVANAHRHGAREGAPVTVRAEPTRAGVQLAVVDHGPGIPEERWEQVFQPFQRLDDTGGGFGLGLAIARGFSDAMGATLVPTRTRGGGLTMTLTLRRAG
jgi:two-component system sensor histidine kinase KdpD